MGCCSSTTRDSSTKKDTISIPAVVRAPAASFSNTQLPLGIRLTGGEKLQQQGWTGKNVKVAVIDSGIDEKHPGFDQQVTRKVWYRSGSPLSQDDHGTHVAGTIKLMAPDADIYDYRVFGKTGNVGVTEAIAQAIRAAADVECHLINMSLGGPFPNPAIREAVRYAASKGVIMVCAAGNEGDNNPLTNEISYPASFTECISIADVSKKKGFPVAVFSNSNAEVDYAGIGVDVVSFKPGGGYQTMSGTSMACPHACGLMACLLQKYMADAGGRKPDLRAILDESHAIDIATEGIDKATGTGFLTYLEEGEFDQLLPRKGVATVF